MIGSFLLLSLFLSLVLRIPEANRPSSLARAAILALILPVLVLVVLATLGIRLSAGGTLALLLLSTLAVFPWRSRRPLARDDWSLLTLAALTGVTGAAGFAASPTMHDLYAHLAWSKDLVSAKAYYPLGFPALLQLVRDDFWPLIGTLRVLPVVLGIIFALQCIAIGERFHSRTAGALAALAYMLRSGKVDPPLPEFLGIILIVATWKEVLIHKSRSGISWLGLLSFALVIAHVSSLEIVHFILLAIAFLFFSGRPLATRLRFLAAGTLGATAGILISPMLRHFIFGNEPLLASQQPGQLGTFHAGSMAWTWGYGFDIALAASVLFFFKECFRDGRWRWVSFFALGSALLIAPVVLSGFGIEIPLQMFAGRQYLSALLFACLGWLVLIARAPRFLMGAFALLLTCQIAHASKLDPTRVVIAASGLSLMLLGLHRTPIGKSGSMVAALVLAGIGIRIFLWVPQTPPWVTWFQKNAVSESVVVTNWPAINPLDAMTSLRAYDGAAGADANLALHRLRVLPEYRKRLHTCDPSGSFADPLATILDSLSSESAYVLLHDDYGMAWRLYAQVHASIETAGESERFTLYQAPPCARPPSSRLEHMKGQLEAHSDYRVVYQDQQCSIYRYTSGKD